MKIWKALGLAAVVVLARVLETIASSKMYDTVNDQQNGQRTKDNDQNS